MRLACGIEDAEDIWADLEQALAQVWSRGTAACFLHSWHVELRMWRFWEETLGRGLGRAWWAVRGKQSIAVALCCAIAYDNHLGACAGVG